MPDMAAADKARVSAIASEMVERLLASLRDGSEFAAAAGAIQIGEAEATAE
jgi:hypothetical protein